MAYFQLIAFILPALAFGVSPIPDQIAPPELTCKIYAEAYHFARYIQPELSSAQLRTIWDALKLSSCSVALLAPPMHDADGYEAVPRRVHASDAKSATTVYVDAVNGDDTAPGTFAAPVRTLAAGQELARAKQPATLSLRAGTHHLAETLAITPEDNGLTIEPYNDELVEISGASPLTNLKWEPYHVAPPMNVYVARNVAAPPLMTGLRINGKRAIRARWPNGDPEMQLFPEGWVAAYKWGAPKQFGPATDIVNTLPNRSAEGPCSSTSGYCYYYTGVGGACAGYGFEPPSGYWCANAPPRGKVYHTGFPSSLTYSSTDFDGRSWKHWKPNETVINAFREGHWFSYVFLVDQYNATSQEISWSVGGFQGGEGAGGAGEWNVENVFEELDSPNEWYYDTDTKELYWFYNGTGAPPSSLEFAGTNLEQLITIMGGGIARGETAPHVEDITIRGLKLTNAALTTLAPHGLPSDGGGDWAIARRGAIHVSGAERTLIKDCLFERNDGNGIMISGYSRNTSIVGNEFHLIGENAVVSWGYTADFENVKRAVPIPKTQGPDATDGNHPQGNFIESNLFHEIGHFQKQVSCYFQAQTQQSTISKNICFNGPRAGVNFNDGMGGGNLLSANLIFNMVRETQDHGSFNSWDRQPFFVKRDGGGTYTPLYNEITRNFWINDYNPQEAVDNDDGSSYYETHHNFFPLATGGLKNDFGGHDNHHHNNIYLVKGTCMGVCAQKPGHEDAFYNNTCIKFENGGDYASFQAGIGGPAYPVMHDNRVYTLDGTATESGKSIASWQASGHDLGTTVAKIPDDDVIMGMAREVLYPKTEQHKSSETPHHGSLAHQVLVGSFLHEGQNFV